MGYRMLMMEDDPAYSDEVTEYFCGRGMEVVCCNNGKEAQRLFDEQYFDLVLLDIMIGDDNSKGYEVCKWIRQQKKGKEIPVFFYTNRDDEMDKDRGYDYDCHEYYAKKTNSVRLLYRRITNTLNHLDVQRREGKMLTIHGITVDDNRKRVLIDGEEVHVTPTQFLLLQLLMENAGRVMERDRLVALVWHEDPTYYDVRVVDRQISKLREVLGEKEKHIKAKPKFGYWFEKEDEE